MPLIFKRKRRWGKGQHLLYLVYERTKILSFRLKKKRWRKERKQEHFKSFVKKISSRWTSKAAFLKKFERLPLGGKMKRSLHRTGCSQWFYDPSDLKRHTLGCKCCSDFADPELVVTWRPLEYILRFDICCSFPPPLLKIITKQCTDLPKCGSLWEETKTGSEGSPGAALSENLKIAGSVVERNKHFIWKCVWHVFV